MVSGVLTVFDVGTYGWWVDLEWANWLLSLLYSLFFCVAAGVYWSRGLGSLWGLLKVALGLVERTKMKVFGGSHLILCSLFIVILLNNLVGVVPEAAKSSAQLFFGLGFAFPIWLGFCMSSVFLGSTYASMASMVLKGLPVVGSSVLWYVELSSIFIRWMTLSVRLSANMSVGVLLVGLVSGSLMTLVFGPSSWWVIGLMVLGGVVCVSVELFMCFLQAFVFVMLLSVYSEDHCFY